MVVAATWGPRPERFQGLFESDEDLARAVLDGVEGNDPEALAALALSKTEYQKEVFPEMPVYGNIPEDLAWDQLRLRSHYGLRKVLHDMRGRAYALEELVYEGGTTEYGTFAVHRDPSLRVRDRVTGETDTLVLFGSVLAYQGRFKLLSYNIDR